MNCVSNKAHENWFSLFGANDVLNVANKLRRRERWQRFKNFNLRSIRKQIVWLFCHNHHSRHKAEKNCLCVTNGSENVSIACHKKSFAKGQRRSSNSIRAKTTNKKCWALKHSEIAKTIKCHCLSRLWSGATRSPLISCWISLVLVFPLTS